MSFVRSTVLSSARRHLSPRAAHCSGTTNAFNSPLPSVIAEYGWEGAWQRGVTPWLAGSPAPALLELLRSGGLPAGSVIVPGCGSAHDVIALARAGRTTTGVDISPTAVALAQRALAAEPPDVAARARIIVADVLSENHSLPTFDVAFDYTFMQALPPTERPAWARSMARVLRGGGELVTLLFPVGDFPGGPPFAMTPASARALLAPFFDCAEERALRAEESFAARAGREVLMRWRLRAAAPTRR
jgi:SAM-dependent methyltransferase